VRIIIEITPEAQAELARQVAAGDRAIEARAATVLDEASHPSGANRRSFNIERAQAGGASIRELREGVALEGLTIRELVEEGCP
jgi:hypothetical protein